MVKFEQLPAGKAKELSQFSQEKWREHLLLFSQVKNRVLEVNQDVYTPLKLEEGKPSPLGLFIKAAFQEKPPQRLPEGDQALEFWPEHKRSALLGRVLFADKQGRIYRDIDPKGIGYVYPDSRGKADVGEAGAKKSEGKWGLLDFDVALLDKQMSEKFLEADIRTYRVLAIVRLEELIMNGKKISLEEARRADIINEEFNPVISVRAFGTRFRIIDTISNIKTSADENKLLVEDAKKMVSQELSRDEVLSNQEYAEWFAETLGKNIGLMHKNGWFHNFLSYHNITLDCRIVDLDSITKLTSEEYQIKDMDNTEAALWYLVHKCLFINDDKKYIDLFRKSYDNVFSKKARKSYFANLVISAK